MHKFLTALACMTGAASTVHAQIDAGTYLLGGGAGYSITANEATLGNSKVPIERSRELALAPTIGYFITANVMVGINAELVSTKTTRTKYIIPVPVSLPGGQVVDGTPQKTGDTKAWGHQVDVGPLTRYYLFVGEKAAFYGQLAGGFSSQKSEQEASFAGLQSQQEEIRSQGFYGQLAPGFVFFPTASLGLEISVRGLLYESLTTETTGVNWQGRPQTTTASSSRFGAEAGLGNLRLGASFYLGRH